MSRQLRSLVLDDSSRLDFDLIGIGTRERAQSGRELCSCSGLLRLPQRSVGLTKRSLAIDVSNDEAEIRHGHSRWVADLNDELALSICVGRELQIAAGILRKIETNHRVARGLLGEAVGVCGYRVVFERRRGIAARHGQHSQREVRIGGRE